jgi:hypothetical protein
MAKDPALLFYTSDFLTGTMTMNNEQVGKYIRLLCLQHQKGILTEKDMLIICGSYDEDIYSKFTKDDTGFFNKRLRFEAEKRSNYSLSRASNRLNKNKKKTKKHMKKICNSYEQHMENENENENIDINKNKKEVFVLPKWIPKETWKAYIEVRKKKKAADTPYALNLVISELLKIKEKHNHDPVEVLNKSIKGGWADVYPLKDGGNNGAGNTLGATTAGREKKSTQYRPRTYANLTERERNNQIACDEADAITREYYEKRTGGDGGTQKKTGADN